MGVLSFLSGGDRRCPLNKTRWFDLGDNKPWRSMVGVSKRRQTADGLTFGVDRFPPALGVLTPVGDEASA